MVNLAFAALPVLNVIPTMAKNLVGPQKATVFGSAGPISALVASAALLVLSVVLLPVYMFDTPFDPRADVPPACTEAIGLLLAFLAARRLLCWQRLAAFLLLLLHSFLFVDLLWHLRVDSRFPG